MDLKVIIQSLYYIGTRLDRDIDKLTALKLIFFADRYHLRKYSRMITNDIYFAMEFGPVASNVKDILAFSFFALDEQKYSEQFLQKVDGQSYRSLINDIQLDMLSETDKEALDFAIDKFGNKRPFDLVEETHKYPEWKRYEHTLSDKLKRENIVMSDFFEPSDIQNDPFSVIDQEIVEISKEFYLSGN